MTHGPNTNTAPITLVTVRPGPVMHVWHNGQEVARVELNMTATLDLIGKLAGAAHFTTALPNEGVQFEAHKAERDIMREWANDAWHAQQSAGVRPEFPRDHIGEAGE